MKKLILLLASAAMLYVSCVKESTNPVQPSEKLHYTLTIGLSEDEVKATLGEPEDGIRKMSWNTGDQISVNGNVSDPLDAKYDGQNKATFTFTEHPFGDAPYLVCYGCTYTDASHIVLPYAQTGAGGANKAKNFPMAAYVEDETGLTGDNLVLYQLCGFINTKITGNSSSLRFVEFSAGETDQLSGAFSISFDKTGVPTLKADGISSSLDRKVRVNCTAALSGTQSNCIIAVPAGTYASSTLRFITGTSVLDGKYTDSASSKEKTITRASIKNFTAAFDTSTPTGDYAEITSATDWNTFAAALNNKSLTNASTLIVGISNDLDFTSGLTNVTATFSGKIEGNGYSFNNITSTKPLFDAKAANGASIENLTLSGTFNFSADGATAASYFGPFAGYASATAMTNCTSNANVSVTGTATADVYLGGLVGQYHNAVMTSCTNTGTVEAPSALSSSTDHDIYLGGLTGKVSGDNERMVLCINDGPVNFSSSTAKNAYIGGIVASTTNGRLQGVINRAEISVKASNVTNTHIGGVAGYVSSNTKMFSDPEIVNRNQASISVDGVSNLNCGGLYGNFQASGTLTIPKSSPFSGDGNNISVKNIASGSYNVSVGGLFGYTANALTISPNGQVSMNKAITVDISDGAKVLTRFSLGGILGHAGKTITLGGNEGNLCVGGTISATLTNDKSNFKPNSCGIGGILGTANAEATIRNCIVESTVGTSQTSNANGGGKPVFVGGIAGYINGSSTATLIEGCTNTGRAQNYDRNNTYTISTGNCTGGIIGNFAKGNATNAITIKSCQASGSIYAYRGYVGGVAGYAKNATFSYDVFTGTITRGGPLGGIAGQCDNSSFTSCNVKSTKLTENAYAAGYDAGGVAGICTASSFDDCTADVVTIHSSAYDVNHGGIIGSCDANTTVGATKTCYLKGTIKGTAVTSSNVLTLAVGSGLTLTGGVTYLGSVTKKKLSIIGDSISTYEGYLPTGNLPYYGPNYNTFLSDWTKTYWGRLVNVYLPDFLEFEKNISWSGSCVAQDNRTGSSYRPAFITRYGRSNYPDGQTYAENSIGDADVVIIFGGTNDNNQKDKGLTDVTTTPTDDQFATIFAKSADALSETSYVEAYVKLIKKIQADRGTGVKVLLIIGDRFCEAQVASVKKIQEYFTSTVSDSDVRCVDMYNNAEFKAIPKASGSHPTEAGMDFLARTICEEQGSWLKN